MTLTTVDSSMIHAVGYDEAASEMEVVFQSGKIYRYSDVPRSIFEALLAADSKGQFMRANVIGEYGEYQVRSRRRR